MNEVYKGGLGSYAVSLTVIGFFNVLLHGLLGEFGWLLSGADQSGDHSSNRGL